MKIIGEIFNKLVRMNRVHGRKGIAIYLAAVTLSIVLTVAFGTSLIALYQLKNINEAGNSVIAFGAAETGIEWSLANIDETNYGSDCPENQTLDNGAVYAVSCDLCGASNQFLCIRSEGAYHGTQRTIKIQR